MNERSGQPRPPAQQQSEQQMKGWLRLGILLAGLFGLGAFNLLLFPQTSLPGQGLRYLWPPLVVCGLVLWGAARYLRTVYRFPSLSQAFDYLMAGLFAAQPPAVVIADGRVKAEGDEQNPLLHSGGPAYLLVQPGNVVVLENLAGSVRVVGPGRHYLGRQEFIKEILGLEEQEGWVPRLAATTKDGIPVEVKDIRFRYRLAAEPVEGGITPAINRLFTFSTQAALMAVYNRAMLAQGIASWHEGVKGVIEGVIRDYIQGHFVDHLTAPGGQGQDPRQEIYRQLYHGSAPKRLRERGAELRWVDIGHFELPEKQIAEQRVTAWQTRWMGNANLMRAYGEAQRLAYQELGRAEAQAELLMSIVEALEDVQPKGDSQQHLRKIVLARIAGLLDAMRAQVALPEGEQKSS